jgi:hypothetical protein
MPVWGPISIRVESCNQKKARVHARLPAGPFDALNHNHHICARKNGSLFRPKTDMCMVMDGVA